MTLEQVTSFLKRETKWPDWELDNKLWSEPAYCIGLCNDIIAEEVEKYENDAANGTSTYNRLRTDNAEQAGFVLMDIDQGKLKRPTQGRLELQPAI